MFPMNRQCLLLRPGPCCQRRRRGLILVVVLIMIALLSLLAASYTFMVRSHLDTVRERMQRFQVRMAAEAGIQHAVVTLRTTRGDVDSWFDNEESYRGSLVLGKEGETELNVNQERPEARTYDPTAVPAVRYSLIHPNNDEPDTVLYGFTDESARLHLNQATDAQLLRLFEMVIPESTDFDVDVNVLVDSLLDWRSSGNQPRPNGAKNEYYQTMIPPYRCKSAPFSTVEELLLVRGFTAWVVFGEDYNRNGLLDPNEDDGDESFPPDNSDGLLFRGVSAYLTLWSEDANVSGDNRTRINLNMQDLEKLQEKLEEEELDSDIISYIIQVRSSGVMFNSVMNLVPAPPPPEEEEGGGGGPTSQPTTQPTGGDPTSQPNNENPQGSGSDSTDQDGENGGSENQGTGSVPVYQNLTAEEPPGTYDDLPLILDRLTTNPSPVFQGLINVSTAPREVLAMITELTDAELDSIVIARQELRGEDKSSPAWLLTEAGLSETKFRQILDKITTKSSVYRIESIGYADNIGVVERIMKVIQMRGPIPQVLYYRNLNALGAAYTPHGDERRDLRKQSG